MGVAVGEVGEGDSSEPERGARGAKPGGGGTQLQLRPSTRLVERPGRREVTPDGLESDELRLQSPEGPQPELDSVPPWSDGMSGLSDRRLCRNRGRLGHPKIQGNTPPQLRATSRACRSSLWVPGLCPARPAETSGFRIPGSRLGGSEFVY